MKRILILLLVCFTVQGKSQNIDEILSTYEAKNGGKEKFADITTLQYTSIFKVNMMGRSFDLSTFIYIETGQLFRKEMAGMFGMKGVYTLITDTAGFIFSPTIPSYGEFQGMEGGVKKMDSATFKSCKKKMNATTDIDDLIDCKAKGSVPELLGTEKIDTSTCYKIKLTFLNGLSKVFWVDDKTYLVKQFELSGKQIVDYFGIYGGPMFDNMNNKNMGKQKAIVKCYEYTNVGGIMFPVKQSISYGANDFEVENSEIQVNKAIDKKWYRN